MNNEIYLIDCRDLSDPAVFREAYRLVSEERRASADKARLEEDKRLTLGAGILEAYVRRLHPSLPRVIHDDAGKPFFEGSPCHLSISHAHDYAMLGIGSAPLGVDLEYYYRDYESILRHFFLEEEQRYIDAAPSPRAAFFELWSRKEAYIKRNKPTDIRKFSVLAAEEGMEYLSFPLEEAYSCVAYVPKGQRTTWHCAGALEYLEELKER